MCEFCEKPIKINAMGNKIYKNMAFGGGKIYISQHKFGDTWLIADNSADEYAESTTKIAFCPKCGRKLTESKENE